MNARQVLTLFVMTPLGVGLAACDDFTNPAKAPRQAQLAAEAPAGAAPSASLPATGIDASATAPGGETPPSADLGAAGSPSIASTDPRAQPIEASALAPGSGGKPGQPLLIKVQVLLDRAHFSPGAIDGRQGSNLRSAIKAFEAAKGLPGDGAVNAPLLQALQSADPGPVTQDYAITAADEKGPFLGALPTGFEALSKLDHVGFATPLEGLAEKFHMSEGLLRELNPKADFAAAGTVIVAVRPAGAGLGAKAAKVEVDKTANQVRAIDGAGKVMAEFPATVGSIERPAPVGQWAVKTVVADPNYSYDPKRLTFGDKAKGALRIAPGPNNPVGGTWIALSAETYGIHGSPDPTKVGKSASHGCVRLTNWDAATLGKAVEKGTAVVFLGETSKP